MPNELEDLFRAERPPLRFKMKDYVHDDLLTEIALHEASHFVFSVLVEKLNLGFTPVRYIILTPETTNERGERKFPSGLVRGFAPPLRYNEHTGFNQQELSKWYSEDFSRLYGILLELIAGYTSYSFFYKEDDYFIGYPNDPNYINKILYFTLETMPESQIEDFIIISSRLTIIGIDNWNKKLEFLKMLSNDAKQLMKTGLVKKAIKDVAKNLMENIGEPIEGNKLQTIKNHVRRLVWNVSLLPFIMEYKNRFSNNSTANETSI